MLRFSSERQLQRATLAMVSAMAIFAIGFYILQNNTRVIGGEIAISKMVWLSYAVLFWLALPQLILLDRRTPEFLGQGFRYLLVLMVVRGMAELLMLYVFNNWSPLYGIAHDVICMTGMALLLIRAIRAGEFQTGMQTRILFFHGIVTALIFIPEIYFAWYMQIHFNTQGGQAIYFVPDISEHRRVLFITAGVDIALTIYLPIFLRNWFHAKTQSNRT